jgi:hypothetical protein
MRVFESTLRPRISPSRVADARNRAYGEPRRATAQRAILRGPRYARAPQDDGSSHTVNALPFSGTITFVICPCIAATNLSAFGSMIPNEP